MVKNTTGGNKHKKYKNKAPERIESKIILAEETQVYAAVIKTLGGKHVSVICSDGETRMCTIEGKHYKRVWIRANDIILVNIETIGTKNKCYLVHKYSLAHITILRNQGLLNFLEKEQQDAHNDVDDDDELENVDDEELRDYFEIDQTQVGKTFIANFDNSDDDSDDNSTFYDRPNNYGTNNISDDEDLLDL